LHFLDEGFRVFIPICHYGYGFSFVGAAVNQYSNKTNKITSLEANNRRREQCGVVDRVSDS